MTTMTNPYNSERGPDLQRNYEEYEANQLYKERQEFQARFDEAWSERELRAWEESQFARRHARGLEAEIEEACAILHSESLVDGVKALLQKYHKLKGEQRE